jgi:hypothetical protein
VASTVPQSAGTRETELTSQFPMHVVVDWLGHSIQVAKQPYCQVTEEHYDLASGSLQNPVQQMHADGGNGGQAESAPKRQTLVTHGATAHCSNLQKQEADGTGFEPAEAYASVVFKTTAFDHSATHPS